MTGMLPSRTERWPQHRAKVDRVRAQLRAVAPERGVSSHKRVVSHQVPKRTDARRRDQKIDLRDLDQILEIDPVARTCTAEPGVTFLALAKATLAHGLVPVVVPELETITIGGAVAGCSLESMSFVEGGFHDGCLEYEVVTTAGDVLVCTPDNEHALVFEMMHSSFGTLGYLTRLTFKLVPAKPFVQVVYETYRSRPEYLAAIQRHHRQRDFDFMDGILHAKDHLVLCMGRFVDRAPYTHRYDWVTVYYRTTAKRKEDYFRTLDYFFRYDRGVTNPTPRSFLGRLLFGKLLDSTTVLRIANRFHKVFLSDESPEVTLDTFLPLSRTDEFLSWYDEAIGFYPLWCVPYRRRDYAWIADGFLAGLDDELFIDLAIYGLRQPPGRNYYAEIEAALLRVQGIKTLIAHNYYDEETFWRTWNRGNYEAVKKITDPRNVLRDLYTKTVLAPRGR